jgi:hypothetical protein
MIGAAGLLGSGCGSSADSSATSTQVTLPAITAPAVSTSSPPLAGQQPGTAGTATTRSATNSGQETKEPQAASDPAKEGIEAGRGSTGSKPAAGVHDGVDPGPISTGSGPNGAQNGVE